MQMFPVYFEEVRLYVVFAEPLKYSVYGVLVKKQIWLIVLSSEVIGKRSSEAPEPVSHRWEQLLRACGRGAHKPY